MEQEENKNRNKNNITIKILIGLVIVLIAGLGITIAYFSSRSESGTKTIKTGVFAINYKDGNNSIPLNNAVPIYDDQMEQDASKISFSAENISTMTGYMDITIEDIVIDEKLKNLEFKWALYETDENYSGATTKVNNGNFRNLEGTTQLIGKNIKIEQGKTKYYNLYIWIRETGLDQQELSNKSFSGKIVIKGNQKEGQKLLSQVIKDNNSPINTTTPSFSSTATTDQGLIKDTDEDGETYYFRGAVEDNYVKFNGLTWKETDGTYHKAGDDMLWRIVRINGDGTIRLIADGSVGNSAFNSKNTDKKYVGYTYDNKSANIQQGGQDSTIKTYLDKWYTDTMQADYDKYIANTRYCNDTTISMGPIASYTYYGAYDRLETNKKPSFKCGNTEKTYGGEYDLKVGLITTDEVAFAGGVYNTTNYSYYLYGKSNTFWTASPDYFFSDFAYVWSVFDNGYMKSWYVNYERVVRPTINLRSDLLYTEGSGSSTDPYVIG